MAQYRSNVGYGLSQALLNEAPFPIQARRAPAAGDIGYVPGTVWINLVSGLAYVLVGVVANAATWSEITNSGGGGAGAFTTLTSTGATTLATTGASVNTFGNTTGATSLSLYAGTGNFLVDGAASTTVSVGPSLTTGTISIGGSAQTGTLTIAGGTGAQTVAIANGSTGIKTISIGTGAVANVVALGSGTGAASTLITSGTGGTSMLSAGTVSIGSTANVTDAILIQTNAGTTEQISLVANQGTAADSITLETTLGGIQLLAAASKGVRFSNGTQAPGIYVGTGSPNGSLSAPQGSLFMNVAGSSTTTRLFVNSNGTTGWVSVTTDS